MKTKNNTRHSELVSESSSFLKPNKLKTKAYSGFTLVELIVVITILTILGTIGFTQMQGYSSSARDSVRTSDFANLTKGLEVFQIKTGGYPAPVNPVVYTGGVSGGSIVSQGTLNGSLVGFSVANPSDPLTKTSYVYSILGNGSYYQLGAELENPLSYSNTSGLFGLSTLETLWTPVYADGIKTPLLKGNYTPDPSLPSLVIVPGSVPTTSGSGGIFSPEVCFVTGGSSSNTLSSGTGSCTRKKAMSLKNMDSGLVGYWDMETLTGTLLKDLSGNGNNGVFSGGMNYNTALTGGVAGKGLIYNGNNNFIEVGNGTSLKMSTNFSISALVRNDKSMSYVCPSGENCTDTNSVIVSKHTNGMGDKGYRLLLNRLKIAHYTQFNGIALGPKSAEGIKYNFTLISGIKNGNNMKIFENGILKDSITDLNLINIIDDNDNVLIGAELPGAEYFSGIIDDVKIYNRTLSDSEIKQQARAAGF